MSIYHLSFISDTADILNPISSLHMPSQVNMDRMYSLCSLPALSLVSAIRELYFFRTGTRQGQVLQLGLCKGFVEKEDHNFKMSKEPRVSNPWLVTSKLPAVFPEFGNQRADRNANPAANQVFYENVIYLLLQTLQKKCFVTEYVFHLFMLLLLFRQRVMKARLASNSLCSQR